MSQSAPVVPPKHKTERWVHAAWALVPIQLLAFVIPQLRPGQLGIFMWDMGLEVFPVCAWGVLLSGLIFSLVRRPFKRRPRLFAFGALAAVILSPILFQVYPSSHDGKPSQVAFRVPFNGPLTVAWGGGSLDQNYHAHYWDQRWAYDLLVMKDNQTHLGDGSKLEDYYYYGRPVVAPADGEVISVEDGHPDMPPHKMGGTPAGGNQIVIKVADREYLFMCHFQPHTFRVKKGDHVRQGDLIAVGGNSGNTSEPHLHIHLQDTPDDGWGEGIPLPFHHYLANGAEYFDHGIPTGGGKRTLIENTAEKK